MRFELETSNLRCTNWDLRTIRKSPAAADRTTVALRIFSSRHFHPSTNGKQKTVRVNKDIGSGKSKKSKKKSTAIDDMTFDEKNIRKNKTVNRHVGFEEKITD